MKLAKVLAKEAKKKGICQPWYNQLLTLADKRSMVEMYVKGIDFCLSNDYPSNDFIRDNFKGVMEDYNVYLDDDIHLVNCKRCIALGATKGHVEINDYGVSEIFAKHHAKLDIVVKDKAFVMIDMFDDAFVDLHVFGDAKVCVNRYGGSLKNETSDQSTIKIVDKPQKTY